MQLDLSLFDQRKLFEMRNRLAYMQGQLNYMSDQYTADGEECKGIDKATLALHPILFAIDELIMPS